MSEQTNGATLMPDLSAAVTGHRPFVLGGPTEALAALLRSLASGWLQITKPRKVVSGLADGWDLAVAEAAVALGIPLWRLWRSAHWPTIGPPRRAAITSASWMRQ